MHIRALSDILKSINMKYFSSYLHKRATIILNWKFVQGVTNANGG
jgi:hypothetical protein